MRLPKPRPLPPAIPVAALANVTLLLVFFFLLSTSFAPAGAGVTLPQGPGTYEAAAGSACLVVIRHVSATGEQLEWRFADTSGEFRSLAGPGSLFFEASRIVDLDPERTFLLRIDSGVRYAVVDDVLEKLRSAGVRNVVLGTRPAGE